MNEQFLIEVYKAEREQFNRTRELQWKINISFWTLLVLGIGNCEKFACELKGWSILISLLLLIVYVIFVSSTQHSLNENKRYWQKAFDFRNTLSTSFCYKDILIRRSKPQKFKEFLHNRIKWISLQTTITIMLLLVWVLKIESIKIHPIGILAFISILIFVLVTLLFICTCFNNN
jgi:membrane protein YdbS with pleckstrin-like domain